MATDEKEDLVADVEHYRTSLDFQCKLYLATQQRAKFLRDAIVHLRANCKHWSHDTITMFCTETLEGEQDACIITEEG